MTDSEEGAWASRGSEIQFQHAFRVSNPVGRLRRWRFVCGRLSLSAATKSISCIVASVRLRRCLIEVHTTRRLPVFNQTEIEQLMTTENNNVGKIKAGNNRNRV